MEFHTILVEAKEAVEKAELPEEFRLKAFEKAIDFYSDGVPKGGDDVQKLLSEGGGHHIDDYDESSVIYRIADKTDIEPEILEEVFYKEEEDLKLIIPTLKLDSSNAGATKEIALLIAGGRQLGGMEDWTSAEIIREKCEYFNKYDSANFAKTIRSMGSFFGFKGEGKNREVRLNRPGQEEFVKLIERIAGEDRD